MSLCKFPSTTVGGRWLHFVLFIVLTLGSANLFAQATGPAPDVSAGPEAQPVEPIAMAPVFFDPTVIDTTGLVSPPFGPVVHVFTTEYDAWGVHFSAGPPGPNTDTAVFSDPPLAWGGVNPGGIVDLLSDVDGLIVMPGSGGTLAQTSSLSIEAGFSPTGTLLLEVFDCQGNLIGSTPNDDGIGPNGRQLMTLNIPGMASFRVSGVDSYGVDSILMEEPEPCYVFEKEIVSGNDVDEDGNIDLVVEVGIEEPAMYDFKITYFDPFGPPVVILDTVPAEWRVSIMEEFYAAPTWSDDFVHFLDPLNGFAGMGGFPTGSDLPNGLGTDGEYLYSGHFTTQEVLIYDLDGNPVGGWPTGAPSLQGLTLVGGELAITQDADILFFEPMTGAFIRSIPNVGGITVEGLTFDGSVLWLLESDAILGVDPGDGSLLFTLPNAASGEAFGGTGITTGEAGELVLASTSGNWWIVSSADGSVLDSGSNGLDMFGLTHGNSNGLNCVVEGANKKDDDKSATKITCYPDAEGGMTTFWAEARCHDKKNNQKCKPTSCGALYLNDGAMTYAMDEDGEPVEPPLDVSNSLCLAAVEDVNGDGEIDYGGGGDEDGDGMTDLAEACFWGNDPCVPTPDEDGDAVPDSHDNCIFDFNPDQLDTDGDGIGDACDPCPNDPDPECVCEVPFVCGEPISECYPGAEFACFCVASIEGDNYCHSSETCPVDECSSSAECGLNQACLVDTCCGYPVCVNVDICLDPAAPDQAFTPVGPTTSGN